MHSEDEDLARAIALSLKESQRSKKPEVITIDDDDDDNSGDHEDMRYQADLQRALEVSKVQSQISPTTVPVASGPGIGVPGPGPSTFLSERAKLEKERLERQKRLRKEVDLDDETNGTDAESDDDSDISMDGPPAKRQHISTSSQDKSIPLISTGASVPSQTEFFWAGELRQTATRFSESRKDGKPTFRLTQVLGNKSELNFAILSSYALDLPWIYEFFDRSVPVIMVAQPDATGRASIKYTFPTWVKTAPPLRGGFGCQHMKFMLLFYKTGRLRVVISTANLISYDWRDMENSVWVQDLPLRSRPIPHDPKVNDDFPSIMQRVLHAVNVLPALKTLLQEHSGIPLTAIEDLRARWDWSKVKAHLVPSIAGKHEGWPSVIKTGHPRLMMAVRKMGLRTGKGPRNDNLIIECQGSSLGSYTTQWMNEFHWSARGESAEDWLDEPKRRREKLPFPPVKVVFPTKRTVQASALGEPGGGTIFCRRRQWAAKNFPRDKFYDSKSKGGPVLMHSKMIIATTQRVSHSSANSRTEDSDTEDDDSDDEVKIIEPAAGWAYVGSHNFTPSAWGTLSGSAFNPILNVTNYELGIIFPLKDEAEANGVACFERPPRKYAAVADGPWIQEESIYHQPEPIEVE
ncbi:phospholipase D/nuclease [Macrolepiota fuliginosa MF-IS2]|uniref:Phospholipase D/nuclease n=1 Tax=Macrolepiota fuliginosa MF-IS2 TaxID=1400762 RepID=A0A9P5XG22_9AGAR|nr:phospholipase D/nuclease [Macrolepiota fuliginosa MF-IS2]